MTRDYFSKLPYCLRTYVEGKQWRSFRDVQSKSFEVLFDSDDHLIISAGTSSGKTEAALFPVITEIHNDRPRRISALYISPLIALIDDQRDRVSRMLRDSGIDLFSWHGDVSASVKRKVLENGEGILQITPESLENIVNRNFSKVGDMFSDLRFVIIDEIHTFMNSDRGLHLLCELEAIERLAGVRPRRIGLSATLSDYSRASSWLRASSDREVSVVDCETEPDYRLRVTYHHFSESPQERQDELRRYYTDLFNESNDYNCLIFTNDRGSVENVVAGLKMVNRCRGVRKEVWAHHSSISKDFRKHAEEMLKDPSVKCTAVATSTLELGIDIGDLDRVIHIRAPQTVSSFIQKFGRSGRRSGRPTMVCFCIDDDRKKQELDGICVDLVKTVAVRELYFNEHWIEPVRHSGLPYSLLFQQTLSYIRSRITATPDELQSSVLSMYPFRRITVEDYRRLLDHLEEIKMIEFDKYHNTYCLDSEGDRITRSFDFGSNFYTRKEYEVYSGKNLVGTVQFIPCIGNVIQLAGRSWEVVGFDRKYQRALVKQSAIHANTYWRSESKDMHTRLMRQMYHCLDSDERYDYLDSDAEAALDRSRRIFREAGLDCPIVDDGRDFRLYPWLGTVQFDTLYRILNSADLATFCEPPFSIGLRAGVGLDRIIETVSRCVQCSDPMDMVTEGDVLQSKSLGKYNQYIPTGLLMKQFAMDRIDMDLLDDLIESTGCRTQSRLFMRKPRLLRTRDLSKPVFESGFSNDAEVS